MSGFTFRCPDCGHTVRQAAAQPAPKCYECIPVTAYTSGHYMVTGSNNGSARAMAPDEVSA